MTAFTQSTPTALGGPHFGGLTERMAAWREEILDTEPSVCVERAVITTQTYRDNADQPLGMVRALMLKNVLERMTIYIEPASRLAGNQASADRAAPIMPEYAVDWVINELDEFAKRPGDRFTISEEAKQTLREIAPFWRGRTLNEHALALMPADAKRFYDLGIIHPEGNITSGDAHIAVNYRRLLADGLATYRRRAQEALDALDLTDPAQLEQAPFYRSLIVVFDAVIAFAHRYADLAEQLAAAETAPERQAELREMARVLRVVPEHPANTFHEAVQSIWLVHVALQIESNGHSLSYGRLDQYLWPFLREDLEAGRETDASATELLTNLWLKTFTVNKIRSWSHTRFSAGSPLYQNVTIGGQHPDGSDAVNHLSYLIIASVAQAHLPQPNLTVRYHHGLSDNFMNEAIELMRLGTGMPAFNSDEVIIPSLIERGVVPEDAHDYSAIGCVEVAVPGRWGYRCTGMSFLNFPKALLVALNDGVDPASGTRLAPTCGHLRDMTSFEQVMSAWDSTIREFQRNCIVLDAACDLALEHQVPDLLCSGLVDDCIGRGKTLKEGGAVYDFVSGLQVGIANLGDSLAAIKKVVFEDHAITGAQLWEALQSDFAGTSSISANVPQGASTAATPDGRHAGQPLAEGCSPSHGADVNGPTAVFKSVSKLETDRITGGVLLNQKVNPQILAKPEDRAKLIAMLRAFFNRLHGFHVQYNVVDRAVLLDAQAHPEQHRGSDRPRCRLQRLLRGAVQADPGRHHRPYRADPLKSPAAQN
ncbi:glycyl radical protein [Actinomyces procaprae]|uniref:glycyl radical protein n=1 Tax=Actinomyces procaprae TaxID=2560010 RepID=UPI001FF7CD19|nr:glycyl radical protein [Actinomyces procaprae]